MTRDEYFENEPLAEAIAERAGTYDAARVVFEAAVEMLKEAQAGRDEAIAACARHQAQAGVPCYQILDRHSTEFLHFKCHVCGGTGKERKGIAHTDDCIAKAAAELLADRDRLREVVGKLVAWADKYPSSTIYSEHDIKRIAAEIDAITEAARASLTTDTATTGEAK